MEPDDEICFRDTIGLGGGERRCPEYTGTQALMLAVLEDGIRDYCGAPGYRGAEAEHWVRGNSRGVFSFAVVCETLGLDPSAVRQALVRLKNGSTRPPRRIPRRLRKQRPAANAR